EAPACPARPHREQPRAVRHPGDVADQQRHVGRRPGPPAPRPPVPAGRVTAGRSALIPTGTPLTIRGAATPSLPPGRGEPMAEHPGFLQAVLDAPDDDAPRLIYADWLDDHGDPARAEFIRLQCRPDPRQVGRAGALLGTHHARWLAPLLELGLKERRLWELGGRVLWP